MGLGEAVAELPAEVATETVPTGAVPTGVGAVLLTYTGATVGTDEEVTGATIVQGQSVIVRVVASVTVYVELPRVMAVAAGQKVVYAVTMSVV